MAVQPRVRRGAVQDATADIVDVGSDPACGERLLWAVLKTGDEDDPLVRVERAFAVDQNQT